MRQRKIHKIVNKKVKDLFYIEASDFVDDYQMYEMMSMPSLLLVQYETPMHYFFEYISRKIKEVSCYHEFARQFVLNFKDGNAEDASWAAKLICLYLKSIGLYGQEYTFMTVPASSQVKQYVRYENFMEEVCNTSKMNNGYDLVNVTEERKAVHKGGSRNLQNYIINENVAGKKVVLFDDVYTTGKSWTTFAYKLESMGAEVVQGVFLAEAIMK